ncbi:hypothetical protein QE390_002980 [Siphonobacter sp. SORGH_AS 1065]|nr:hypothetical protein [Siphonobacter sp. SORGH_AS_1065]
MTEQLEDYLKLSEHEQLLQLGKVSSALSNLQSESHLLRICNPPLLTTFNTLLNNY